MEFFNVSASYYQITESWIILKMSWAALVFLATHWHQSEPKPTFWTASSSPFLLQFLWFRPASKATLQLRPHFLYCSPSISAENSHLKRVKKLHGVRRVVCSSLPTLCGSLCGNKHMKKKSHTVHLEDNMELFRRPDFHTKALKSCFTLQSSAEKVNPVMKPSADGYLILTNHRGQRGAMGSEGGFSLCCSPTVCLLHKSPCLIARLPNTVLCDTQRKKPSVNFHLMGRRF